MFFPDQAPPLFEALQILWGGYLGVFIAALLTTLLLTPVFRHIAIRYRIYDMPDTKLKPHAQPIPYLGGLAIFAGFALPTAVVAWSGSAVLEDSRSLWFILAATTLVVLTGLLDDLLNLKPLHRIAAEVLAALILAIGGIIFRGIPGGAGELEILAPESTLLVAAGIVVQIALVVTACNATNLLDGLDGLCSGVTAIIAVGFLLIATSISGWDQWADAPHYGYAVLIMIVSMALLGAALGFLPYNFNPASIFMGDAGSMLLGFLCAVLVIMFGERPGMVKWSLAALFCFGLPLFDTTLAFARRWLNNRPIFAGDRSHFYDQLVDRGLTVKQAVIVCYALALFFVTVGVLSVFVRLRYSVPIYLGVCIALAVVVVKAGMLRVDADKPKPIGTAPPPDKVETPSGK